MNNKNMFIAGILTISTLVLLPGCDWIKNMRNKPHTCCSQEGTCSEAEAQACAEPTAEMTEDQKNIAIALDADEASDIAIEETIDNSIEEK